MGANGERADPLAARSLYRPTRQCRNERLGDFVVSGIAPFLDLPATGMDKYGPKGLYLAVQEAF